MNCVSVNMPTTFLTISESHCTIISAQSFKFKDFKFKGFYNKKTSEQRLSHGTHDVGLLYHCLSQTKNLDHEKDYDSAGP